MVRRAERPPVAQPAAGQRPGDRRHHGHVQQLAWRERRQQRSQPLRQHRLPRAGWPDHQKVVPASGRHLQRPLGTFLAADLGQIRHAVGRRLDSSHRRREDLTALEMVGKRDQAAWRQDVELRPGPCGLWPRTVGADETAALRVRADRRRQRPGHRRDGSVERQLPQHDIAVDRIGRDGAKPGHQADSDGQVVVAALLGQIRGGEIDRHPPRRHRQAGCMQRRPHALAALGDRLVGQSDDMHAGLARRDHHLNVDRHRLDALKRDRANPRNHSLPRNRADATPDTYRWLDTTMFPHQVQEQSMNKQKKVRWPAYVTPSVDSRTTGFDRSAGLESP